MKAHDRIRENPAGGMNSDTPWRYHRCTIAVRGPPMSTPIPLATWNTTTADGSFMEADVSDPNSCAVIWARTSPSPPDERDRAVLYSTDVVRRVAASGREAGMSDLGDLFVLHDTQPQFHPNSYIVHPSMYLYL